jgi:hypothetical protein
MLGKLLLVLLFFVVGGGAVIWLYAWYYRQRMERPLRAQRTPTLVKLDYSAETNRVVIAFPGERARMEDIGNVGHVYYDNQGHVCRIELDADRLKSYLELEGPLEYSVLRELPSQTSARGGPG